MPLDGSMGLSERLPTREEIEKAKRASRALAEIANANKGALSLRPRQTDQPQTTIELPPAISRLVMELLLHISKGEAVTFVPFGAELTTQQAADLLNVSRPYLIKLVETKQLPHHKVGTHRRIRAEDVLKYKRRRDAKRAEALDELARLGQEIDSE
jgi:excisionase family DNA binding protein